jgi:hypothetical protein
MLRSASPLLNPFLFAAFLKKVKNHSLSKLIMFLATDAQIKGFRNFQFFHQLRFTIVN